MVLLFLVYGLAFFLLGFAILIYPKKDSSFKLAKCLWLIAAFGISHGVNEWIDLLLLLQKTETLKTIRAFILPVSFLFLIQFATKTIVETKNNYSALKALPWVLFISWTVLTYSSADRFLMGDIWARYLLGGPGTFLTAYALAISVQEFKEPGTGFHKNLNIAAAAFFLYGVVTVIVPAAVFFPASLLNYNNFLEAIGIPVQAFRCFFALVAAYGIVRLLSAFDHETRSRTKESEKLFRIIFDNAMDGILLADIETKKFFKSNRRASQMLGHTQEELNGLPVKDIHPVETLSYVMEEFERLSNKIGSTLAKDIQVKRKDGSVFYADINSSRLTIGNKDYMMGILRDISERKAAEEKHKHHIEQLTSLRSIDKAISSSLDLRVTLEVILQYVRNQLNIDAADILLCKKHIQSLEYAAGQGFTTKALQYTRLKIGEGHAGRAALDRQTVCVSDLAETEDGFKGSMQLKEEGFVSYYGVPLIAKGSVQGVLEIFNRIRLEPDQEWLDFLHTLAGQAAIAIDNASLFENLQRTNVELTMAYDETIDGWSRALDLRDKETEGHSQRVTELTLHIAKAMGVSETEQAAMRWGALLHDIGKMGVPDRILLKPGPLDDEEKEFMRRHPVTGYEMLSPIRFLRASLDIPYCHHERWDGKGYPRGLKEEQIPLAARIFAVADIFDALCSDRPYRPAWTKQKTFEHIRSLSGNHLDPKVVEAFLKLDKTNLSRLG